MQLFTLTTDTADERILGYTLRGGKANETFPTMEAVLARVQDVPAGQCCWATLEDALIDLTWRQEQWDEDTISKTVRYWSLGEVRQTTINNPQGVRLDWDDILGMQLLCC